MEDPKFRPMFVILPDEVMNEWAEWLAKKSFNSVSYTHLRAHET